MVSAIAKEKKEFFTYGDYIHWDDSKRWEIIDGVALNMSPAPGRRHQDISIELSAQLRVFFRKKECKVYAAPFDVLLPEYKEADEEIRNVVQPDISIIYDKKKLTDKGCKGAPDVTIEILSPSTAEKDMKYKMRLYQEHGVKEYWILDQTNNYLMQFRMGDNKRFEQPEFFTGGETFSPELFPGLDIDLGLVFAN